MEKLRERMEKLRERMEKLRERFFYNLDLVNRLSQLEDFFCVILA